MTLIEIRWAGICGSDIELINGTRSSETVHYPVVPGHEWSGVVIEIGADVDRDLLGKEVVGENIRSCGECGACRSGSFAACADGYVEAGFTLDGAWADQMLVPAAQLHSLGRGADLRSAAGIEPGACAATAVARARVESHHRVAIVGGGTIGMLCAQLVRTCGAEITMVDPRSWRVSTALLCGATRFVDLMQAKALVGHFDVVIEAAGVKGSAQVALDLARRSGRVVLCGLAGEGDAVFSNDIVVKNLDVAGVFGATKEGWATAVAEFVAGNLRPEVLVTHEFPLAAINDAVQLVEQGSATVGKVLIRP